MSSASRSIRIASRSASDECVAGLVELVRARRGVVDAERRQQRAVRDEVGVAPDRRGEVAVVRRLQPGVAEVRGE